MKEATKEKLKSIFTSLKKIIKTVLAVLVLAVFYVFPFLNYLPINNWAKWAWIVAALVVFIATIITAVKKPPKQIYPNVSVFVVFLAAYLCRYWGLLETFDWVLICSFISIVEVNFYAYKYSAFQFGKKTVPLNDKCKKDLRLGGVVLFGALCFGYSIYIDNTVLKFIIGGIGVIALFANIISNITHLNLLPKSKFFMFGFVIDIVILLSLTVYMIYIIEDVYLQDIVLAISAAVIGGALTLAGVAWTIRKGEENRKKDREQLEQDRKAEEKKKAKPLFTFNPIYEQLKDIKNVKVVFDDDGKPIKDIISVFPCVVFTQIENSERSSFCVERIYHDKQWWETGGSKTVLPNKTVYFEFNFSDNPDEIFVEIKDSMDNLYYYKLQVLCLNLLTKQPIYNGQQIAHTIRDFKEITLEELNAFTSKKETQDNA